MKFPFRFLFERENIIAVILLIGLFHPLFAFSKEEKALIEADHGIYFYSYEVEKEKRTSLHIPLSDLHGLGNQYAISFDFKIRMGLQNFGYIFRMIGKDNINLDLVVPDLRTGEYFSLIFANKSIVRFKRSDIPGLEFGKWNHSCISFTKDSISVTVNDVTQTVESPCDVSRFLDIYFGANEHPDLFTTEVPPMIVRNLRLYNKKQKEIYYWPLAKHGSDVAYDVHRNEKAYATNPRWEIDNHYNWKKKLSVAFDAFPQTAFDKENERLFIVCNNKISVYHVRENRLETISGVVGNPYNSHSNQLFYDPNNDQLVSYEILENKMLRFDFTNKNWGFEDRKEGKAYWGHHCKYFMPEDSLLVTVGGYGHHKYKGTMMKYPLADGQWTEVDISKQIFPRYLASMGYLGEGKFLYFGGYGNESGNQEEYPRNFYDLYQIDVHNDSIKKLWEQKPGLEEGHYTNGNSMVIDKENRNFYVLSYANNLYNSNIQIKQFSIDKPAYKLVGDSIPYTFIDNRSFCDLFLCEKSGKLLAVTIHSKEEENSSKIDLYSIHYKPFAKDDIFVPEKAGLSFLQKLSLAAFFAFLLLLGMGMYVKTRKRKQGKATASNRDQSADAALSKTAKPLPLDWLDDDIPSEIIPSSVILLGGFQVIDAKGTDMTKHFSPTLKSLFLFILLSTLKAGKGVTSISLKNTFWFDKDDNSARNNRNVNLSKIRPLLQRIGNIEISEENSYWCVSMDKSVFCDYQSVRVICAKLDSERELNKPLFVELLRIASRGLLLPNVHAEWVDSFKSDYSSTLIDILIKISEKPEMEKEYELLSKAGDVILLHDSIDEDGIRLKCYGLYHSNRKGKALQAFNKFCEEYKNLLGEEYTSDFNTLVKPER